MDVDHQAPLSMGFLKQEYWSGLPSPGDLHNLGIELASPLLAGEFFCHQATREAHTCVCIHILSGCKHRKSLRENYMKLGRGGA